MNKLGRYYVCRCCFGRSPVHRLRLADGTCVFLEWHSYLGPSFYRDRACRREIEEWWDNELICAAVEWFTGRGKRA